MSNRPKKIKKAVTEVDLDLSQVIDALPGLVWIARPDGRAELINRRWRDYTGLKLDQAVGFGWQSAIHPEDLGRVGERWQWFLKSGEPGEEEARLRRHDGVYRRFLFRVAPISDSAGRVVKWFGISTEIEERLAVEKRAQADANSRANNAEVKRAYEFLAEAQRLSRTGSYIADLVADEHTWSEELYRIFEFDPGTKISVQAVRAMLHPDDVSSFEADFKRSFIEGSDFDQVFRIIPPSGTMKYVHSFGHQTNKPDGRPVFIGVMQDVTVSKQAEQALRVREAELRQAHAHFSVAQRLSHTGSFIADLVADEHVWSEELYRIFELDPDAAPKIDSVRALVHPEDQESYDALITHGMQGQDLDFQFRIITPRGGMKHLRGAALVSEHISDRPVLMGAVQDVTESRLAEEALIGREAELRWAYGHLTEAQRLSRTGSFTADLVVDEHTWSEELYRICEFSPGCKITARTLRDIVHPEDVAAFDMAVVRAVQGVGPDFYFRIITSKGTLKYLRTIGHRTEHVTDHPVFFGAVQDVTEQRLAELALDKARSELTHMARVMTLGALTGSIAHEINQPLSGIITNASTCLRMLAAAPPNLDGARATAQRTLRDGKRASEVIQRLHALFARRPPTAMPVDLSDAAEEVLALTSSELHANRVALKTDFTDDLPPIGGDRVQLQQVILNIVLNAIDAMREVNDRPRTLLVQTAREAPDRVRLSVRDSGQGIDPQKLETVFDAFYTTKSKGMGVGLSISRSIIESHRGRLWATSNEGPGATFSFWIPSSSEPVP